MLFSTHKLFIFTCLILINLPILAEPIITITTLQESKITPLLTKIVSYAYKKAGYNITIRTLPAERALKTANKGKSDAELVRTRFIEKNNPNLIRIPTVIYIMETVAFTKKNLNIESKKDLEFLRLGFLIGHKQIETFLKGYNTNALSNKKQLFKLLQKNRIDVALIGKVSGKYEIKELELNDIIAHNKALISLNMYHYVHKKNKKLVPILSKIFNEMEESGKISDFRNEFLKSIL